MESVTTMPMKAPLSLGSVGLSTGGQLPLLNERVSTQYPKENIGQHHDFRCETHSGKHFYCKSDDGERRIRATEWFCTTLARHVGVAVADYAVVEDEHGATYFGSMRNPSTADESRMKSFLNTPNYNELGQSNYPGWFLYGLHGLDLLFNNRDRYPTNFVLVRDGGFRLSAIDFGSANLLDLATARFPASGDTTLRLGQHVRSLHGNHIAAAFEMIDRVMAIPMDVIDAILQSVPPAWMPADEKRVIRGGWSDLSNGVRLPALRAGLSDGSLA